MVITKPPITCFRVCLFRNILDQPTKGSAKESKYVKGLLSRKEITKRQRVATIIWKLIFQNIVRRVEQRRVILITVYISINWVLPVLRDIPKEINRRIKKRKKSLGLSSCSLTAKSEVSLKYLKRNEVATGRNMEKMKRVI